MKRFQIFCDFDGTLAENDVGQQFFLTFSDPAVSEAAVRAWMRGEISSAEMYRRELAVTRARPEQIRQFALHQRLSPGAETFIRWCQQAGDEVFIVSDGFAVYIRAILEKFGLQTLPLFANDLEFNPAGALQPVFPYLEHSCGRCANCKGYHVRRLRKSGWLQVYIGDGYSDRCAVSEVDIVFAKRDLAKYCDEKGIAYHAFENFEDVQNILEKIRRTG